MVLFLAFVLAACDTTTTSTFDQCEVDGSLSVESAAPGDTVVLTGRPLTEDRDSLVTVGPVAVDATVAREGCEACDACVADVGCDPCGACVACEVSCASCVETATFAVPDVDPGEQPVILTNAWGSTAPLPLVVTAPTDGT